MHVSKKSIYWFVSLVQTRSYNSNPTSQIHPQQIKLKPDSWIHAYLVAICWRESNSSCGLQSITIWSASLTSTTSLNPTFWIIKSWYSNGIPRSSVQTIKARGTDPYPSLEKFFCWDKSSTKSDDGLTRVLANSRSCKIQSLIILFYSRLKTSRTFHHITLAS